MEAKNAGTVYLASTWAARTMVRMVREAVRDLEQHRPLVAVSYAATSRNSNAIALMESYLGRIFRKAEVRRFAVEGEPAPVDARREAERLVRAADIVFLAPGDPVLGASLLNRSEGGSWIREAHQRGAACFGMSAGAILLGQFWGQWKTGRRGELVHALGLVPDTVVDCHDEDAGWPELRRVQRLVRARGLSARAIGLPAGTGMIVAPDHTRFVGEAAPAIVGVPTLAFPATRVAS